MLREIIESWRSDGLMAEVEGDIRKLFRLGEELYTESYLDLLHQEETGAGLEDRFARLKSLAAGVRRKIAEHLNVSGCRDVRRELLLFGIADDMELIGDSSRNILQLTGLLRIPLGEGNNCDRFRIMAPRIKGFFARAERALFESDEEDAGEVIEGHLGVNRECERIQYELMQGEGLATSEAVACILAARSFRRVSACLEKVASAAVGASHDPSSLPTVERGGLMVYSSSHLRQMEEEE